jgi:hypothetical protein
VVHDLGIWSLIPGCENNLYPLKTSILAVGHPSSCAVGSGSNAAGVEVCVGHNFLILPDVAHKVSGQTTNFMFICVT